MTSTASLAQSKLLCPACDGPVEVKSRHVAINGTVVRVYCSADCLRARTRSAEPPPSTHARVPRRRRVWWLAGTAVGACMIISTAVYALDDEAHVDVPPPPAVVPEAMAMPVEVRVPDTDPRPAEDEALLREIAQDAWIHPLAGPARRMPANHNGAFGAERPGERPPECVSGHCGVDIGRVWGEPVHAVHDGVVDWVNRGPNEDRGGIFVKVAHRDGTLFSWYFHLAGVPRWVQPGVKIRAGQVIGVLGDTGVKHSAPHLHFSLSVKTSKTARERYLDPEPLIAIWPLWMPDESERGGRPSTTEPGLPVREPPRRAKRKANEKANDKPVEPAPEPPAASEVATPDSPAT